MSTEHGVPANVNPFCIVYDEDIADGAFSMIAPQYFVEIGEYRKYICPTQIESPALTQEEAEDLVRKLIQQNIVESLAIKIDFIHIIPEDRDGEVFVITCNWDLDTGECVKYPGINGFNW